jgi:hypothetical protein
MAKKKQKARPRSRKDVPVIVGPQPPEGWISVSTAIPKYDRPVLVTDGAELAHCAREMSDRNGDHYMLVDEGSEFSDVTHWMEEPLLPNGKRAKRGRSL